MEPVPRSIALGSVAAVGGLTSPVPGSVVTVGGSVSAGVDRADSELVRRARGIGG